MYAFPPLEGFRVFRDSRCAITLWRRAEPPVTFIVVVIQLYVNCHSMLLFILYKLCTEFWFQLSYCITHTPLLMCVPLHVLPCTAHFFPHEINTRLIPWLHLYTNQFVSCYFTLHASCEPCVQKRNSFPHAWSSPRKVLCAFNFVALTMRCPSIHPTVYTMSSAQNMHVRVIYDQVYYYNINH